MRDIVAFTWFSVSLLLLAGFTSGVVVGMVCQPADTSIPFVEYLRALKTVTWDYRSTSSFLEHLTGIPIMGASSAVVGMGVGSVMQKSLSSRYAFSRFLRNSALANQVEEGFP